MVWTGEEFGIVWLGDGSSPETAVVYLARLSSTGELVAPPRAVTELSRWGEELAVAFGNGGYAVAWIGCGGSCLLHMDRYGTMIELASGSASGLFLAPEVVGLASDDTGFGVIATETLLGATERGRYGSVVFMHFRMAP